MKSLVLLALPAFLVGTAQEEGGRAETPAEPAPPAAPSYAPAYHGLEDVELLFAELALARPEHVRTFELARSRGGRPIPVLELGAPGPVALEERPTLFLVGGLDGVSLAGSEAVLHSATELVAGLDGLSPDLSVVCVPWAGTDGLARTLAGEGGDGRNDLPIDDDGDGTLDEDGPEDLDGDGVVLSMLVEDPGGDVRRGDDPRRVVPAGPGEHPRYLATIEGSDTDGDGRFNEDPRGGVVLDRSFPVGWRPPWEAEGSGPWPLSEPGARALAALLVERRTVCVLLFQSDHGGLAVPGGTEGAEPAPEDAPVFEELARTFARETGRTGSGPLPQRRARGREVPGSVLDWIYRALGAAVVEVSPWGPGVRGASPSEPGDLEAAWLKWVDNVRGGIGFEVWHPVDLGGGPPALVGGWLPLTRRNPPAEMLPEVLGGLSAFVAAVARGLPRTELSIEAVRDGPVCHLSVRARNVGRLPTGLSTTGAWRGGAGGVELSVEVPEGATWFAGRRSVRSGVLYGGEATEAVRWSFVLPPRGAVRVRCEAPLSAPVDQEVRP